ncbi:MAG: hypothetical protein IJ491_03870 [Clostridia bacterium]|nr:hypothetical protein [Clostridia bacterium]
MDGLLMFLCFGGAIGFVVGIIMLIVKAIKGGSKKSALIVILISLALFVISPIIAPETAEQSGSSQAEYNDELESYYNQIVAYATQGYSKEGDELYKQHSAELQNYKDAINYANYCVGLTAYNAGALNYAYSAFQLAGNVLNTQTYISDIQAQQQITNGIFKCDNGQGTYLHIAIKDGEVDTGSIGYYDADQTYVPTYYTYELLRFVADDGRIFYGIGRYNTQLAICEVNYYIHTYDNMQSFTCNARPYNSYDNPNPVTIYEGQYTRIS